MVQYVHKQKPSLTKKDTHQLLIYQILQFRNPPSLWTAGFGQLVYKGWPRANYLRQHRTKPALRALHASCLHIFRHIAQVLLGGRQPAGVELVQSDEKLDGAICAQALYGVALKNFKISAGHTPFRCASLCMTGGNRAAFAIRKMRDFLKFNASTLR